VAGNRHEAANGGRDDCDAVERHTDLVSGASARRELRVEELWIPSSDGGGGLLFYDRVPFEREKTLDRYWVRIAGPDLTASREVYAGYAPSHPASLFADMARRWSGWEGDLTWESLEGEMTLGCSHDGLGHISIGVELRSGLMPVDWRVKAAVTADAGQLEGIAHRAAVFFGEPR
jgi:hypothetical protein